MIRYPDNDTGLHPIGMACPKLVEELIDRRARRAVEGKQPRTQSPRPTREASEAGAVYGFNSPNRYRGGKA